MWRHMEATKWSPSYCSMKVPTAMIGHKLVAKMQKSYSHMFDRILYRPPYNPTHCHDSAKVYMVVVRECALRAFTLVF